ncbi:MAG: M20/M25/M40 family metallo-hydrolase, partial [Chloroflexia bacterium]|nr:M20/M25/M40 family metallo-hydrolase [Chloroflexia bacterium]
MNETLAPARIDRAEIVALASRLIAIPSPSGAERAIMADVTKWCDSVGLGYETVALDPDRPNIIVTIGDPARGPTVVMNGHLDTVPVSDADAWQSGPYQPTITDDGRKLVGRGASDMKSSVAVMLHVVDVLKDVPLKGCVQVHVVSDEEVGGTFGTIFVLSQIASGKLPRPDYCLIGEKSDLKVRNAERGLVAFE